MLTINVSIKSQSDGRPTVCSLDNGISTLEDLHVARNINVVN